MQRDQQYRSNPDRFFEFQENIDGSGFVVEENGREVEFFYDGQKGWFDEFGNYFNSSGTPSVPNKDSLAFWDTVKYHYEEDDELLREYEKDLLDEGSDCDSDNDEDDFEDHSRRHDQRHDQRQDYPKISRNQQIPQQTQTQPQPQKQQQQISFTNSKQQINSIVVQQPIVDQQFKQDTQTISTPTQIIPTETPKIKATPKLTIQLSGFSAQEQDELIKKWLETKAKELKFQEFRSKVEDKNKLCRFSFENEKNVDIFWEHLGIEKNSISYKGKYRLTPKRV